MKTIKASEALFIKLGASGAWDRECFKEGTLRLGYRQIPHKLCADGQWDQVLALIQKTSPDKGAARRHLDQIRKFYEAPKTALWITFSASRLHWCFANSAVEVHEDGTKTRKTVSGWSDASLKGEILDKKNLNGRTLATQGFRGTICKAADLQYLLNKINGTVSPQVVAVQVAARKLEEALIPIIQALDHKDLETLVDQIFRQGGWSRIGVLGGQEKDIDLDLISAFSSERIAVQIKSRANPKIYETYKKKFSEMAGYAKFYFVTHSPDAALTKQIATESDDVLEFWGAERLADYAVKHGLAGWLMDKAG